jgi:hypothetical protein
MWSDPVLPAAQTSRSGIRAGALCSPPPPGGPGPGNRTAGRGSSSSLFACFGRWSTRRILPRWRVIRHFAADVFAFDPEDEVNRKQKLPEPPRPWGMLRPTPDLLGVSFGSQFLGG